MIKYVTFLALLLAANLPSAAQNYSEYNQGLVSEHIYEGLPGYDNIYIRQAYILSYNHDHRIPNWVAYHVEPDYTKTVPRYGVFSFYRKDENIPNAVTQSEYNGIYNEGEGYARGLLAPFGISGGDRDDDGLYGVLDTNRDGEITKEDMEGRTLGDYVDDANEINRVYEMNYMSNIAPMDQDGFYGEEGIWGKLEQYIQETIVVDQNNEVWVMAGTILGRGAMEKVGPDDDITVPPMFFKIVVREDDEGNPLVLAFLLPHHKEAHGEIEDYLVSVDLIEAMTGLDFFRNLDDEEEAQLESGDTWINWERF